MKLVIAEKPSVAKDLARVVGSTVTKDGYIQGDEYFFTWCFGHLIQLAPPESYGYKGFSTQHLPMLPENFILLPRTKNGKSDDGVNKQIKTISSLFEKTAEIIVATDAGREGELIFRYLYQYIGIIRPLKRLWLSSLTDTAIRKAFNELREGSAFNNLYYSARARSEADWLVGLNTTQALTIAVKSEKALSLGRVQTPTLAMICGRYLENKNFMPETFFQVAINVVKESHEFFAISEKKFKSKNEAIDLSNAVNLTKSAFVKEYEKADVKEAPPKLFDLTSLQQEANKKFSFSADDTLKIAQSLYEKKFITYPRTGSKYITEDMMEKIPSLIKVQTRNPALSAAAVSLSNLPKLNPAPVNDSRVTDHHALLPTEILPDNLIETEAKIYQLIASRLLESFGEECIKEKTKVKLEAAANFFTASGSQIKFPGWRSVNSGADAEQEKNSDEADTQVLPALIVSEKLPVKNSDVLEKKTKPKPIHTEASLLKAMETAGKEIEDEELRELLKDKGIGTPATRAAIIEILFTRAYILKQKKALIPTQLGLLVYQITKDMEISSPQLTAEWEHRLVEIEQGKLPYQQFNTGIRDFTKKITAETLSITSSVSTQSIIGGTKLSCPKCKEGSIKIFDKAANCSRQKQGCDFVVFRTIAGKKLAEKAIDDLVRSGKTKLIKGFTSKSGSKFDAMIELDSAFKTKFTFPQKSSK